MHRILSALIVALLVTDLAFAAAPAATPTTKPVASPATTRPSRKKLQAETEEFFTKGPLPRIHVEISPAALNSLRQNGRAYTRATLRETAPGQPDRVYEHVAIHIKGAAGSTRAIDDRPALTVVFDAFGPEARFHGLTKVHLNNSVQDGTYMEENLGGSIFRDAGLPAPRVTNARVWLNNRDLGCYVVIEPFNKSYIHRFFGQTIGSLYDGGFVADIDQNFRKILNDPAHPCDPKRLIEAVREPNPALRRQKIEKVIDIDQFYTFMAVEALLAHWDGYSFNRNNYRLYHNPKTDKFVFLCHGMDQLFRSGGHPLVGGATLCQAVLQTPEDRARYMQRVAEIREKCFDPEKLQARIDAISARIMPLMAEISPAAAQDFKGQTDNLKARVLDRIRNVDRMLNATLKFDASGIASLKNWTEQVEGGATLDRPTESSKPRLRIRAKNGAGSFRTTVTLARGKYTFEGLARVNNVTAPAGQNTGAGLRISGGKRPSGLTGTTDWQKAEFNFETTEPSTDIVLVVELRATSGEAMFDPDSLKLRKR